MSTREDWLGAFLFRLKYPVNWNTKIALLTWIRSEWGSAEPIPATFNPLNCVMPRNGSTRYNSVGVQNYRSWEDGVEATALTLLESGKHYEAIRTCFAAGVPDLDAFLAAVNASDWGSHPTANFLTYVEEHLDSELARVVGVGPIEETFMILCPKPPLANGRQAFAVLDIPGRRVLLYNGASLSTPKLPDHVEGDHRVWPVPSDFPLLGMDRTRNATTLEYDKRGVVIAAADGGSFEAHWT